MATTIPQSSATELVRLANCPVFWQRPGKACTTTEPTGDLDPLECCAHRFVSGVDDASVAYAAESLKLLRAEIERRTTRLKALDRAVCPGKRVTRELAAKRSLKLWPIVCVVDEAQNLFSHEKYGKRPFRIFPVVPQQHVSEIRHPERLVSLRLLAERAERIGHPLRNLNPQIRAGVRCLGSSRAR